MLCVCFGWFWFWFWLGDVDGKHGGDGGEEEGVAGVLVMGDDGIDNDALLMHGVVLFGDVGDWVVDDRCGGSGLVMLVFC